MQNNQSQPKNPKLSHFEELSIEILTKQNHNLFQTVNQLKHQLTQQSTESRDLSHGISRAYVRRILQFVLFSVAMNKAGTSRTPGQISEKSKNRIMSIICDVLDPKESSETNVKNHIERFVHDVHSVINQVSEVGQVAHAGNKIEDEGKFSNEFAL